MTNDGPDDVVVVCLAVTVWFRQGSRFLLEGYEIMKVFNSLTPGSMYM